MKRLLLLLLAAALGWASANVFAQTPEEIVGQMEKVLDQGKEQGLIMTMTFKLPIVGTFSSRFWNLKDKSRVEAEVKGIKTVTWMDKEVIRTYNSKTNEVLIKAQKPDAQKSATDADAEMFEGIADGYDISLTRETPEAWYLHCKKSKNNKEKDDPKNIDLVIAKGSYLPINLSTSMMGVNLQLSDVQLGVSEKQVTFNPDDYPDVKIVDER